jgi:hypothetical protein
MSEYDDECLNVLPFDNFMKDATKEFLSNLMKETFSEKECPVEERVLIDNEVFLDNEKWISLLKNIEVKNPILYPNLGKPYTHYKPEPKFEHYYMVLENYYDGSLKPFDPCIYYDLKPNQKLITSIYLKSALEDLRWKDKTAWIEVHLHLIRLFLDPKLNEKESDGNEHQESEHCFKYQIMTYFNQFGKHFFYEIFSKTEMKRFFQRFEDLDTLIEDAKNCHLIPESSSKNFDIKDRKDEAFLEWVSLYVTRDYLSEELKLFESSLRSLSSMMLLMNYFTDGILDELKLDSSEKEFFTTIFISMDKDTKGKDQSFVKMIKNACLHHLYDLRSTILSSLRESPQLIDHIHYETSLIRKKFKNSNYPQISTEYLLFNWNNVGFVSLNDPLIYDDIAYQPLITRILQQKKFYEEIRTKVFRSAKEFYYIKARINFNTQLNRNETLDQTTFLEPPYLGGYKL